MVATFRYWQCETMDRGGKVKRREADGKCIFGKWLNSCVAQVWKMVYRTSIWRTKYRKEMRLMFWKPAADDVMCSGHSVLCSCIIPLVSRHLTGR